MLADIDFIALRVLELVCTANDLRPFAEDMGYHGKPFRWDEVHHAQLRAELDATYARLYGLTRDELRYTPLASIPKKSTAKTLRHFLRSQGGFPWRNLPRVAKEKIRH